MSNRFLDDGSITLDHLVDGTGKIYIDSIRVDSIGHNLPVKVDGEGRLFSSALSIADIEGAGDIVKNPFNGKLKVTDLETENIPSLNDKIDEILETTGDSRRSRCLRRSRHSRRSSDTGHSR